MPSGLGFNTEWKFAPNWTISTDVAWLPFAHLDGKDTHFQRSDMFASTPEIGAGVTSVQLEASWEAGAPIGDSNLTLRYISKRQQSVQFSRSQRSLKPSALVYFFKRVINLEMLASLMTFSIAETLGAPISRQS